MAGDERAGAEAPGPLGVPRGDAAPVFEPSPRALDEAAGAISAAIIGGVGALRQAVEGIPPFGADSRDAPAEGVDAIILVGDQDIEAPAAAIGAAAMVTSLMLPARRAAPVAGPSGGSGGGAYWSPARGADPRDQGHSCAPPAAKCAPFDCAQYRLGASAVAPQLGRRSARRGERPSHLATRCIAGSTVKRW